MAFILQALSYGVSSNAWIRLERLQYMELFFKGAFMALCQTHFVHPAGKIVDIKCVSFGDRSLDGKQRSPP